MSHSDDCVRVAVRIRPLIKSELEKGCQIGVERVPGIPQVVLQTDSFTFNYVFDATESQEMVYNESVHNMIGKLFNGYNVTILAYGQTGSGKTYTMGTAYDGVLDAHTGVIPRAIEDIFQRIEQNSENFKYIVKCSFMELYQEQLFDLLGSGPREQMIVDMREDRNGIVMPGLTEVEVTNSQETAGCLLRGSAGRAVASTAMNETSSRSHAIFTINLQAKNLHDPKSMITSKFHLVDLAGSERSKKTKATGDRFKEGVKINQGLLALGNVISALDSNQGSFVCYRDSKLTRLLQDSLGGNSVTLMIACISPADYNIAETLSTLRYADRARKIKNKPIINQDPHAAEISQLKAVIQKLRLQLLDQTCNQCNEAGSAGRLTSAGNVSKVKRPDDKSYEILVEKHRNLQKQFQDIVNDVTENEMRAHLAELAMEKFKNKTKQLKNIFNEFSQNNDSIQLADLGTIITDLDDELHKTGEEIFNTKRTISTTNDDETSSEMSELMQEQSDVFTSKQMDFNEELRRINRELSLKENLHVRVIGNLNKFCSIETDFDEKYKECEEHIQKLETEKAELMEMLKQIKPLNTSAKLAEERRKRVQALEEQIAEMKQKSLQQAKILKLREKETEKVKNLQTEIQAMKESKVKLIRAMRTETEKFRQWKLQREKEILQLKGKDRKMQNEMARKEALHTKQNNVLKRKCEEAMAINKRLKDAIDKQKAAQLQRKQFGGTTSKIEKTITWISHELEVILSVVDAEISLEELMEVRTLINERVCELKSIDPTSHELESLMEDLEMRNAQISDLQQKVISTDIEKRIKAICESIQNLPEAKAILKHLLKIIPEARREYATKIQEMKSLKESVEEKLTVVETQARKLSEDLAQTEKNHEEKLALLLQNLNSPPVMGNSKKPEQSKTKTQTATTKRSSYEIEEYESFSDDLESGAENDPDWRKTPRNIRKRSKLSNIVKRSIEIDERNSGIDVGGKRKSDDSVSCRCRGDCRTKRCSCRLNNRNCNARNCKCSESCTNGRIADDRSDDSADGDIDEKPDYDLASGSKILTKSLAFNRDTSMVRRLSEMTTENIYEQK